VQEPTARLLQRRRLADGRTGKEAGLHRDSHREWATGRREDQVAQTVGGGGSMRGCSSSNEEAETEEASEIRPAQERDAEVGRVELKKGERNPRNEGVEKGMLIWQIGLQQLLEALQLGFSNSNCRCGCLWEPLETV
jgi:hypothetical protein